MAIYHYCPTCEHYGEGGRICGACTTTGTALPSNYELADKKPKAENADAVNHPSHYNNGRFECIEVMTEIFGIEATQHFCLLNAFKYIWRCKHKGKTLEDIKKSNFYLEKFIELECKKNGKS